MNIVEQSHRLPDEPEPITVSGVEASEAEATAQPPSSPSQTKIPLKIVPIVCVGLASMALTIWRRDELSHYITEYYPSIPVVITGIIALKQVVYKDWKVYPAWVRWSLLVLIVAAMIAGVTTQREQVKDREAAKARAEAVERVANARADAAESAQRKHTELFIGSFNAIARELGEIKTKDVTKTLQSQITALEARLESAQKALDPTKPPVDLTLSLVGPRSPALVIINKSSVTARQIKWGVALWNVDRTEVDPLPIPIRTFDWLKANGRGGPLNLFGAERVAALLKPGDRLYGTASVDCPECGRGRTYAVFVRWNEGGWFAEIDSEKSGGLLVPNPETDQSLALANYLLALETSIPLAARMPIRRQE